VNQRCLERRGEAKVGWAGCEGAGARCGCSDTGRRLGVIPLRVVEVIEPRLFSHLAIMEKCAKVLEVHRAGWGGSGAGGRTLEDRYGACSGV